MKKLIFLFFLSFFFMASANAFFWNKKPEPSLFFTSTDPRIAINYDEKIENHSVFKIGQRIYFLVYNPQGFKSDYIKYQVIKQDDNAHIGGFSRIRNIVKRVSDKNYYIDYIVLSEAGKYALQIFDIENLHQWIIYGHFRVVEE